MQRRWAVLELQHYLYHRNFYHTEFRLLQDHVSNQLKLFGLVHLKYRGALVQFKSSFSESSKLLGSDGSWCLALCLMSYALCLMPYA